MSKKVADDTISTCSDAEKQNALLAIPNLAGATPCGMPGTLALVVST